MEANRRAVQLEAFTKEEARLNKAQKNYKAQASELAVKKEQLAREQADLEAQRIALENKFKEKK